MREIERKRAYLDDPSLQTITIIVNFDERGEVNSATFRTESRTRYRKA